MPVDQADGKPACERYDWWAEGSANRPANELSGYVGMAAGG